jgi:hypothetical protein
MRSGDSISRRTRCRAAPPATDARAAVAVVAQKLQSHSPVREIAARRVRVRELQRRFAALPSRQVEKVRQRFRQVEGILRVLGPDATLRRGYSITTTESGTVVKSVAQVAPGNRIKTPRRWDDRFALDALFTDSDSSERPQGVAGPRERNADGVWNFSITVICLSSLILPEDSASRPSA